MTAPAERANRLIGLGLWPKAKLSPEAGHTWERLQRLWDPEHWAAAAERARAKYRSHTPNPRWINEQAMLLRTERQQEAEKALGPLLQTVNGNDAYRFRGEQAAAALARELGITEFSAAEVGNPGTTWVFEANRGLKRWDEEAERIAEEIGTRIERARTLPAPAHQH